MTQYTADIWVGGMLMVVKINAYDYSAAEAGLNKLYPTADAIHITELP